jgi:hypothetical protein
MKQIAPGVMIIGNYMPETYDPAVIGEKLLELTNSLGMKRMPDYGAWPSSSWSIYDEAAEVRSPDNHVVVREHGTSHRWHRDGTGDTAMVVWSNREGTEIKLPDGTEIQTAPGDIVALRNTVVEHRTPDKQSPDRWFFRRTCVVPEWL